jgi:signal transduction histidine kinase
MDLVEQLAAYTRSDAIECTPTNACRAISGALDLVRCTLPSRIALHAVVPLAKLIVAADATQLHRLVMNLCGNAIHAMQQGGVLRVKLARSDVAARRALSHGTLMPGPYAVLSVEDEGCGMDRATLARMFEPFFTTRPSGQGSGLGLAVVKAIVGQCRGAIDVKSARSRGTTFTIYLRCIEPKLDIA